MLINSNRLTVTIQMWLRARTRLDTMNTLAGWESWLQCSQCHFAVTQAEFPVSSEKSGHKAVSPATFEVVMSTLSVWNYHQHNVEHVSYSPSCTQIWRQDKDVLCQNHFKIYVIRIVYSPHYLLFIRYLYRWTFLWILLVDNVWWCSEVCKIWDFVYFLPNFTHDTCFLSIHTWKLICCHSLQFVSRAAQVVYGFTHTFKNISSTVVMSCRVLRLASQKIWREETWWKMQA